MAYVNESAGRSRLSTGAAANLDRILLAACAVIWLAALGTGVAAAVALVDLGTGHPQATGDSETPWLLYTVIGVSAAVIIAAVPLLLRARRSALAEPPARTPEPTGRAATGMSAPSRGVEAQTEKLRVFGTSAQAGPRGPVPPSSAVPSQLGPNHPPAAVEQLWLRCALVIAIAMGIAMIAIGVATYLMAAGSDTAAWALYVFVGIVTVAMPVAPWFFLRQQRELVGPAQI